MHNMSGNHELALPSISNSLLVIKSFRDDVFSERTIECGILNNTSDGYIYFEFDY